MGHDFVKVNNMVPLTALAGGVVYALSECAC
jgi:hypothetical protein